MNLLPPLVPLPVIAAPQLASVAHGVSKHPGVDDLLLKMAVVQQIKGRWHARAQGCTKYANGATPDEAMRNALVAAST